jgi:hypothetical protein
MNRRKTAARLLLSLFVGVIGAGEVLGQSRTPETTMHRRVSRDTETRISTAARYRAQSNGQCTVSFVPVLELVTPPKHGTVRFVTTDVGVPRGSGCNNSVNGQAVMYRPDPGFVGKDQFTYNSPTDPMAFDVVGPPGLKTVFVTVLNKN